MSKERRVSVSRLIDASPQMIFDVLADPARHTEIDGSGTVRSAKVPGQRLAMGTKFGMKMKLGVPYSISSTVVEFEEDKLIAWAHFGKHRWRYELEVTDGATMVTETFDWSTSFMPLFIELVGYPKTHTQNMRKTLERLEAIVTATG